MRRICVSVSLALVIAACAPSEGEPTTSAPQLDTTSTRTPVATTTTVAPASTTTSEGVAELPQTGITAVLGQGEQNTYKVEVGTFASLPVDEAELPVPPGSMEVHWYTFGDRYAVAYIGLDMTTAGPLCPGNSILTTGNVFQHVSNAPTEEGACEGFTTLTDDPEVGPIECNGSTVYVTAIPAGTEGILFGSLEALTSDGSAIVGLTSQAPTGSGITEIDIEAVCG